MRIVGNVFSDTIKPRAGIFAIAVAQELLDIR